MSYQRLISSVL